MAGTINLSIVVQGKDQSSSVLNAVTQALNKSKAASDGVEAASKRLSIAKAQEATALNRANVASDQAENASKRLAVAKAQEAVTQKRLADLQSSGKASAEQLALAQAKAEAASQRVASATTKEGIALQQSSNAAQGAVNAQHAVQTAMDEAAQAAQREASAVNQSSSASSRSFSILGILRGLLGNVGGGFLSVFNAVKNAGGAFLDFSSKLGFAFTGLQGLIQGAMGVGQALLGSNADMEVARVGFTQLLGSAKAAGAYLKQLQAFAAQTPFELPDVLTGAQRLISMGFSAKSVIPMLTSIGNQMGALGKSATEVNQVVLVLGQMHTAGRLNSQDMMQLTTQGIPAWQYLATAMHKTIPEVRALTERGIIPADFAVQAMLKGMNSVGPGMEMQSKTMIGVLSTLKDNAMNALRSFTGPLFEQSKANINSLASLVASDAFQNFATVMGEKVGVALQAVQGFLQSTIIPGFMRFAHVMGEVWALVNDEPMGLLIASIQDLATAIYNYVAPSFQLLGRLLGGIFTEQNAIQGANALTGAMDKVSFAISKVASTIQSFTNFLYSGTAAADATRIVMLGLGFAISAMNLQPLLEALPKIVLGMQEWALSASEAAVDMVVATWPILAVAAAIAGLVALFVYLYRTNAQFRDGMNAIGQVFQNIWSIIVTQLWPALQNIWTTIQAQLWPALQNLWKSLQPFLPILQTIAVVIVGVLVVSLVYWAAVLAGLANGLAGFLSGLAQFLSGFITYWSGFITFISGLVSLVVDLFTGNWGKIGADLAKMWSGVVQMFQGELMMLQGIFNAVFGAIWGYFSGFFSVILGFLGAYFKPQFAAAGTWFQNLWSGIVSWWTGLWGGVGAWFGSVGAWFQNAWSGVSGWFIGLWGGILSWFGGLGARLGAYFTIARLYIQMIWNAALVWIYANTIGRLQAMVSAVWPVIEPFATYFSQVFETIRNIVVALLGIAIRFIIDRWNELYANTVAFFGMIWQAVSGPLTSIRDAVVGAVLFVVGYLQMGWNAASSAVSMAWAYIWGIISQYLTNVQNTIMGAIAIVVGLLAAGWNVVSTATSSAWAFVWGGISGTWTNIRNTIAGGIAWITGALSGGWAVVTRTASVAWAAFTVLLSTWWNNAVNTVVSRATQLRDNILKPFQSAKDMIGGVIKGFVNNMISWLNNGIAAIENFANQFGTGLNNLAKSLGTEGTIKPLHIGRIPAYARGTPAEGHPGGAALVGEKGREIVVLPRGAQVIPNKLTEKILRQVRSASLPAYADGVGDIGSQVWDWVANGAQSVLDNIIRMFHITTPKLPGVLNNVSGAVFSMVKNWAKSFIDGILPKFDFGGGSEGGGSFGSTTNVPGNLKSWIAAAMSITHVPSNWASPLAIIAMHESGGSPTARNDWDINAQNGIPSQGLFQTIPPTFNAYALPGHGNILNPIDNAIAAIRYIQSRYQTVFNVPGIVSMSRGGPYVGYAGGGVINEPIVGIGLNSNMQYRFGEGGIREAVIPVNGSAFLGSGGANVGGGNSIIVNNYFFIEIQRGVRDVEDLTDQVVEKISTIFDRRGNYITNLSGGGL